jgi:hypothetical protein
MLLPLSRRRPLLCPNPLALSPATAEFTHETGIGVPHLPEVSAPLVDSLGVAESAAWRR